MCEKYCKCAFMFQFLKPAATFNFCRKNHLAGFRHNFEMTLKTMIQLNSYGQHKPCVEIDVQILNRRKNMYHISMSSMWRRY